MGTERPRGAAVGTAPFAQRADYQGIEVTMDVTRQLSEFVANAAPAAAEPVIHQAKRCLMDWLGVGIAGSVTPGAKALGAVAEQIAHGGEARVLGSSCRVSELHAALVNGFSAHVLDYDDTFNPGHTTVHGSAPVWPAVMVAAERHPTSGLDALQAFVVGFETETRVALGAGRGHYEVGWHVTGTVGHLGAAAAAARVLKLPAEEISLALGTAGTQAAGLKEVYGSMGKALHPGKAAFDGFLSALLVRGGFTSTTTIVEGRCGFLNVLSPHPEPERVIDGIGEQWTLLDNGFKAYACGSLTHPCIDAIIGLRDQHGIDPDDVDDITVVAHPYVLTSTGLATPTTGLEGKFSIYHCAAVAMLDGAARLDQFTDVRVRSADVVALRQRVSATAEPTIAKDAVRVSIRSTSGDVFSASIEHNKGTPGNPMSDDELEQKFHALVVPHIGEHRAVALADACWRADELDDIRIIMELACDPAARLPGPMESTRTRGADAAE